MPDRVDARDPSRTRLPPGQIVTRKWPVLHYGTVPSVDLAAWRFEVSGAVERPLSLTWEELGAMPRRETACDIHCVTRWSRYDNVFEGVPVQAVLARAGSAGGGLRPGPRRAGLHHQPAPGGPRPAGQPARLPHNGEPLAPEHGGPVRLLVPHLYLWKSAKWVTGFSCSRRTFRGSGSRTDTTCGGIRGGRSATAGPTRCGCGAVQIGPAVRPRRARADWR